jgi:hypothetical protein
MKQAKLKQPCDNPLPTSSGFFFFFFFRGFARSGWWCLPLAGSPHEQISLNPRRFCSFQLSPSSPFIRLELPQSVRSSHSRRRPPSAARLLKSLAALKTRPPVPRGLGTLTRRTDVTAAASIPTPGAAATTATPTTTTTRTRTRTSTRTFLTAIPSNRKNGHSNLALTAFVCARLASRPPRPCQPQRCRRPLRCHSSRP